MSEKKPVRVGWGTRFFSTFSLIILCVMVFAAVCGIPATIAEGEMDAGGIAGLIFGMGAWISLLLLIRIKLRKRVKAWKAQGSPQKRKRTPQEIADIQIGVFVVGIAIAFIIVLVVALNKGSKPSDTRPKTRDEIFEVIDDLYPDETEKDTWEVEITFD